MPQGHNMGDGIEAFTPGPWEAAERGGYCDFDGNSRVILGDDRRIGVVQHHGTVEDEANAHLIASAPELYDALIYVRENLGDPVPVGRRHVARRVDAALAKARGEA